ncbi:putative ribonuclease H-like domain-containing protein, partial [Tanacetum coccineum]
TKACDDACKAKIETIPGKDYILLPLWTADPPFSQSSKSSPDVGFKPSRDDENKVTEEPRKEGGDLSKEGECNDQEMKDNVNSTNNVNAASTNEVNVVDAKTSTKLPLDPNMLELEDYSIFEDDEDVGAEADINNLDTTIQVSPIPTIRIHKDHPLDQKNPKRNEKDERGIVIKNKVRFVAQGYTQEEGIDYDEVFALVVRIKAIRLFLAYASFKDFVVYQMDFKSAFLYDKIVEGVYVYQPPGFEDPNFPDRVYKVEKALYGLHQAPRAWDKGDILLVQVYVDDIIFGSTKKSLCSEFEKMMHKKFQMSSIGELTFFLGLQVKQKEDGIFISQPKLGIWYPKDSPFDLVAYTDSDYVRASLDRKSTTGEIDGFEQIVDFLNAHSIRHALTINPTIYISCIEQFWSTVKEKTINGEVHLHALVDGKKIIISEASVRRDLQLEDAEGLANPIDPYHIPTITQSSNQPQKIQKPRKPKRKDTQVPQPSDPSENVVDEAVHKELGDSLVRAATTASSLEAEQDNGNINKTQSKATPNESSSQGTNSGGGPWCQETMGDTIAQTRFESVSKYFNDSLLTRGNTLRSDEDRLKLDELMAICTTLQNRVLDL